MRVHTRKFARLRARRERAHSLAHNATITKRQSDGQHAKFALTLASNLGAHARATRVVRREPPSKRYARVKICAAAAATALRSRQRRLIDKMLHARA